MVNHNYAVDTNVLIYLHDSSNIVKRNIAKNLLANNPKISSQIISEYLNVTRKLLSVSKEELLVQSAELFSFCEITPVMPKTLLLASSLIKKYQFQLFDAIVVAAALEVGAEILYSEDMHHSMVVNDLLTIINPFL